jgi:hypothetical protein
MRSTAHLKRGRRLFATLMGTWMLASTLTLTRPLASAAHALSPRPAENTAATVNSASETPTSGSSGEMQQDKRGILPPWHEQWIPEMRRQPGRPERKTTV